MAQFSNQIKINWYSKTKFKPSSQLKLRAQTELCQLLAKIVQPSIIEISFISQEGIRRLNQKYRQIPEPTDVLSFPLYPNLAQINSAPAPVMLGEIAVCPDYLKKAGDRGIIDLILHAARHLIGKHHK